MTWNWQKKDWPHFRYDRTQLEDFEAKFLYRSGVFLGSYECFSDEDREKLTVDVVSSEALKTSEIEGEYLNRDSIKSSVRRNFGLNSDDKKASPAEQGIAEMMVDLYRSFDKPLTHEILFSWHKMLTKGRVDLKNIGAYRTHTEPMQIVSGPIHNPKIHFEAPPSKNMMHEMSQFIKWFNETAPQGKAPLSFLTRAGIAHIYFVCIHPFEDGNGRISRALVLKALSQSLSYPTLISLSDIIQDNKKDYYYMLEAINKTNEISEWLIYFSQTILDAQDYSQNLINFIIKKGKFYNQFKDQLNERQAKVIARIFKEGIEGFQGGLSAENYISITKTSRATATRDLQDLVDKGVLIKKGELKSTRYCLK